MNEQTRREIQSNSYIVNILQVIFSSDRCILPRSTHSNNNFEENKRTPPERWN